MDAFRRGSGVGKFQYLPLPVSDAISVELMWVGQDRKAFVHMPEHVVLDIKENQVAMPDGVVGVEVAMGFALFVAMSGGLPLYVTGDKSVWNIGWGALSLMA